MTFEQKDLACRPEGAEREELEDLIQLLNDLLTSASTPALPKSLETMRKLKIFTTIYLFCANWFQGIPKVIFLLIAILKATWVALLRLFRATCATCAGRLKWLLLEIFLNV